MRNYFTFGGLDSRNFGIYISGSGVYNAPERDYERVSVAGRDGDLLLSNQRLNNIKLTYPAFVYTNFKQNIAAMRDAFLSLTGYQQLTDTYHPDEYRMAYFAGGTEINPTKKLEAGDFKLSFMCKPQRYLLTGATPIQVASGDTLTNPTQQPARPLIRVYGQGTLNVGSYTVTVGNHGQSYIDIDCDIMDCFNGTQNLNQYVILSNHTFPTLKAGANGVTYTGITAVEITPRWWRA